MFIIAYSIWLFFVLALTGHALITIWKLRRHLHILQLNSYFNDRYLVWLYRRKSQIFGVKELEPLLALVGIFFHKPVVVLFLLTIIYFKNFLALPKITEKKPLVFTPRVIRLLVANMAVLGAIYLVLWLLLSINGGFEFELALVVLILYGFFQPFILIFINWILWPLEYFIQGRYVRDAHKYLRSFAKLKVVGITGSFGKTTTKYIIAELLKQKFNTLKTPGSYNTLMGVTKIIRTELKPIHEIFVVEMSAKNPGDIQEICELVTPQYGIITAIGKQHLETFKNIENIKNTKSELIRSLPENGVAFFNLDDPYSRDLIGLTKARVVTYGVDSVEADYRVSALAIDGSGSNFTVVRSKDKVTQEFKTKLLGRYNIHNLVGAIAVAAELGVELVDMVYPIKQVRAVPHRLELKKVGRDIIFIDDAFNANPIGSKMALEVLGDIAGKRKIIVTPGMIELGEEEEEYNKAFGENIASVCDYVILVGEKQTLPIQQGLLHKSYPPNQLFVAQDFAAAKKHLEDILQSGDVVLFENDLPDNYSEKWE